MWHPVRIVMKNLLSHKDSAYEFSNNSCTVIYGKNRSDRGMENNGAGKSTIFDAISLAYSGQPTREGVDKEKFINRDEEECYISWTLENAVLKQSLRIDRWFFRGKKASKVKLYENGELNKEITSVLEANKRIVELVGISREDLTRYFIIPQDSRYSFFAAGDGEKKEIINRITSADQLKPVLQKIETELKANKAIYNDLETEISNLTGKVEILEEQREELVERSNNDEELKRLEKDKKKAEEELKDFNKKSSEFQELIEGLTEELLDVEDIETDYKTCRSLVNKLQRTIEEHEELISNINRQLTKEITCPDCGKKFFPGSGADITPEELTKARTQAQEEIKEAETKIKKQKNKLVKLKEQIAANDHTQDKIDELEREMKNISTDIKIRKRIIENATREIKVLKDSKNNPEIKKIDEKIKAIRVQYDKLNSQQEEVKRTIDDYTFWNYNMGKNGFMTYLANQSIKIIEGTVNSYLQKFNTDLSLLVNGFKVLADGSIRDKIDIFIQDATGEPEAFSGYSGGERGRIIIAGILAINKLINMSTNGKGLNLLCLDEALPGIDALGQKEIIKVLEGIGITTIVVTQNVGKEANFSNVLYVEKKNKVSKYVEYGK